MTTRTSTPMAARFASTCRACGERIAEGASIVKHSQGVYVHQACRTVPQLRPARRAPNARNGYRGSEQAAERRSELEGFASGDLAELPGMFGLAPSILDGIPRERCPEVLAEVHTLGEDPPAWEVAAVLNVAAGRCPDGCCP